MRVLVVGPNSIHVSSFIKNLEEDVLYLGESKVDFCLESKQYQLSYRSLNPISLLLTNKKLKQLLKQLNPDVVHIHQVNRTAYFVSRICDKMNIPCISTAWGSDILLVPKQNQFYKYLVTQSIKRSRFVTADSADMIEALKNLDSTDTSRYIHLQYGIDEIQLLNKENIIYSNRLHEANYRIDKIIHYFREFRAKHSDWRLVVAGSGSLSPELKELTGDLSLSDSVEFMGWLSPKENRTWYARASVFISIPKSDGSSVSLLEAISAQCVPVVSDLVVSKEWIENGVNGVLEDSRGNPLLQAVDLLNSKELQTNSERVKQIAGRKHCMEEFKKLYARCIQQ